MNPIITSALMTFGAGFTGASFAKAEGPGQALDDIMTLVGFDKLHEVAEKKRAKREQNIMEYKNSIAQQIAQIPEENIQEPSLSIVGPAWEASKYYIEEAALREMFAKVVGLSMDNRFNDKIHVSFVDIIRQLSQHDAKVLQEIKSQNIHVGNPIASMRIVVKRKHDLITINPVVVLFNSYDNFQKNAVSINNLERLGVLSYHTDSWSSDNSEYDIYQTNPNINNLLKHHSEMTMEKTSFSLTDFGANFIDLCVD